MGSTDPPFERTPDDHALADLVIMPPQWLLQETAPRVHEAYQSIGSMTSPDSDHSRHKYWTPLQDSFRGLVDTACRRMLITILFAEIAWRDHSAVGSTDPPFERSPDEHALADLVIMQPQWLLQETAPRVHEAYQSIGSMTSPDSDHFRHEYWTPLQDPFRGLVDPACRRMLITILFAQIAWRDHSAMGSTEPPFERTPDEHVPADLVKRAPPLILQETAPHVHEAYQRIGSTTSPDSNQFRRKYWTPLEDSFSALGDTACRGTLIAIPFAQIAWREHFAVGSTDPPFERTPGENATADLVIVNAERATAQWRSVVGLWRRCKGDC